MESQALKNKSVVIIKPRDRLVDSEILYFYEFTRDFFLLFLKVHDSFIDIVCLLFW